MKTVCAFLALGASLFAAGCGDDQAPGSPEAVAATTRVAYVTNGVASFWTIAAAGARAAAADFGCECDVRMPADVGDQQRIIEDLLTQQVDGIAISPIDAVNQASMINEACKQTRVITHDSDAPTTKRLAYVGIDNYDAGRLCGKLVLEALPDGGSIILFVGRLEQDNARRRRQGVIDEVLGRSRDPSRYDTPGSVLGQGKYEILDTRTDQFDTSAAKRNAEDALALYEDLGCMVGLFAYNPPACLEALRGADKLGKVKLVAFDEDQVTLQAIVDGHIWGTVVQNPYRYGYESVRILAGLARGEDDVLPEGGFLDIPARAITPDNVVTFRAELEMTLAGK